MAVFAGLLSFLISFLLTGSEVVTTKYPYTVRFVVRSWAFWALCVCYGIIAVVGFCIFKFHVIKFEGMPDGDFAEAAISGFLAKSIIQLNLFTVTSGSQNFPVGLKTLVQIFEPYLTRKLELSEYNAVQSYLAPFRAKYKALKVVMEQIDGNIPSTFPADEIASFKSTLTDISTDPMLSDPVKIRLALEKFFRFAGTETLTNVFPV